MQVNVDCAGLLGGVRVRKWLDRLKERQYLIAQKGAPLRTMNGLVEAGTARYVLTYTTLAPATCTDLIHAMFCCNCNCVCEVKRKEYEGLR